MKKFSVSFLLALTATLVVGCASAPPSSNIPDFVLNPPIRDDVMIGIGRAGNQNEQLSLQMADSRARQDIAFQLSAQVQAMITDYAREAGTIAEATALQLSETVGRQLTNTTLNGARPEKREKTPDGTWWVMVTYPKAEAAKTAASLIDSEAARYAEFKAMEATKLMDAQLDKAELMPTVVGE
ncbi:hypothetical protein FACS189476_11890 [Spirochaetia bacterium]|nr:hypothetical protein FACS189476_11890 [Spirochaetia bacterium]